MQKTSYTSLLKEGVTFFPLITVAVFISGYIGFHTFIAIYNIPVIDTDISIIIGLGLFNISYLVLLYFITTPKREPGYIEVLIIYSIFSIFLKSPIGIPSFFMVVVSYMALKRMTGMDKIKRKSFTERRSGIRKIKLTILWLEMIVFVYGIIIELFIDSGLIAFAIINYWILQLFYWNKREKRKFLLYELALVILFPVMSMYYCIYFTPSNLIGLNKQNALIITAKDSLKTEIIFSDNLYFYTNNKLKNEIVTINKSDIKKIVTKPSDTLGDNQGLYKGIIKEYKKHFSH